VSGGAELKAASQARVRRLLTGEAPRENQGTPAAPSLPLPAATAEDGVPAPPAPLPLDATSAPEAGHAIWGVGGVRGLGAYERYAGVDFRAKLVLPHAERGGLPDEERFHDRMACLG